MTERRSRIERRTAETDITVSVDLDGSQRLVICSVELRAGEAVEPLGVSPDRSNTNHGRDRGREASRGP